MKKFYISKREGESGIYKYSCDFYDLLLKEKGYVFLESDTPLSLVLSQINISDAVHIEIGIFLANETTILLNLIEKGYKNISITLHDAPLMKFPFFRFKNAFLNKISKAYDLYIDKFHYQKKYLTKVKAVYVLTQKGTELMRSRYKLENIFYLPHIANEREIKKSNINNCNFICFGYIGRNKGIQHSLELHQELLKTFPAMKFYVVGKALGAQQTFYASLKEKFLVQTFFTGYVPEEELNTLFEDCTFAFLLFNQYKFYVPFSGSILHAMKKGKIVFTNNTNATNELVEDGKTGFQLSGNLEHDCAVVKRVLQNTELKQTVKNNTYNNLMTNYTSRVVAEHYQDYN